MKNETATAFRKTTSRGMVLEVSFDGTYRATVDGIEIPFSLRYLDAPRTIAGKTVVAQIGSVGLTREELTAVSALQPEPAPVDAKYEHAVPMTRELANEIRDFERGAMRQSGLEED